MKFGLTVPSFAWPGLDQKMARLVTKGVDRRAEALGYDSITAWDHLLSAQGLYGGSWMELLMALRSSRCGEAAVNRRERVVRGPVLAVRGRHYRAASREVLHGMAVC